MNRMVCFKSTFVHGNIVTIKAPTRVGHLSDVRLNSPKRSPKRSSNFYFPAAERHSCMFFPAFPNFHQITVRTTASSRIRLLVTK